MLVLLSVLQPCRQLEVAETWHGETFEKRFIIFVRPSQAQTKQGGLRGSLCRDGIRRKKFICPAYFDSQFYETRATGQTPHDRGTRRMCEA